MKLNLILFIALFGTLTIFSQEKYKIIVDGKEVFVRTTDNDNPVNVTIAMQDKNISNANIKAHTVKPGENLFSISRAYNLTVAELCKLNGIDKSYNISIGEELKVANFTKMRTNTNNASYHIVTKGDTLYSLAKRYGTTVEVLKKINYLASNEILINQKLKLH